MDRFELRSPKWDEQVAVSGFSVSALVALLEPEEIADHIDLNQLLQSLIDKHGIEKFMDELTNVCTMDEIQVELSKHGG